MRTPCIQRVMLLVVMTCTSTFAFTHTASSEGGKWLDPQTWRTGKVPPTDSDTVASRIRGPVALSEGCISTGLIYLRQSNERTRLRVGPLAHLNVGGSLRARSSSGIEAPLEIIVEGSVLLNRGADLYGETVLNIKGGHLCGIGRKSDLERRSDAAPTINVTDGGVLDIRALDVETGSTITINGGEIRISKLEIQGRTTVNIQHGFLAVGSISGSANGSINLGPDGRLLLEENLDATSFKQRYPAFRLMHRDKRLSPDQLTFTPGLGRLQSYTVISRLPSETPPGSHSANIR